MALLRRSFNFFDKDGSGTIDIQELSQAFRQMGRNLPDETLQKLIDMVDKDKSGTIDFDEYVLAYNASKQK